MAKDPGMRPIVDALIAAGLVESIDKVRCVYITADPQQGVFVTVVRYGDPLQVADALNKLTEVGYRLVKEETEHTDGD